uniref:Acetolactate synthase n=1 Tax=Trieres chinensis TaxID=1514140 RepID=A0A7S2E898_TRICV|mmetsp:Transcript_12091/g.25215  ORF Transcript_12091/g.25215 Transcript_12091/m.25215 type:complete len:831 (+) Transcript_12091:236-2728(+)|eukprot:CAMPEP_0183320222 /NCGR_PEP_ID=MMETSP0160_2-20130417/65719_1 /TAXON_ID=2839 ORGANISM="Odontella Sinensis, Strain Grunow 1884" /NCGR_SAMPLE_ID=MMETSP0160_2 /ASSEMBLY_ACC=CAM_ASM_000250 /LENGTH=830 /DNA_ID=CAMNT_0025486881 /DNA_START=132 /DNA_END=2624 /DNA_ORIENTATION=+
MKLPTAAVALFVATATTTAAFSPAGWGVSQSTAAAVRSNVLDLRPRPFGARAGTHGGLSPFRVSIEEEIEIVNGDTSPALSKDAAFKDGFVPMDAAESALSRKQTRRSAAGYASKYVGQSAASIIYSKLQENGVQCVNGYSGGAILPLLDQFHVDHPRHKMEGAPTPIRWITNSNESSSGHIAEGIAKSSPMGPDGRMQAGVVVATSGPGFTNLITPITDAMCDGVPLVVLAGQAATFAPAAAFQSCPAVEMATPCTKWSYQITNAAEVPFVMDYAFFVARQGRPGPVFIDLPKDIQNQVLTSEGVEEFTAGLAEADDGSFVSLASRQRDGESFHAIRLGDKNLSFEVVGGEGGEAELRAVPVSADPDSPDDMHMDHHCSDVVFKSANPVKVDGTTTTSQTGSLSGGPVMDSLIDLIKISKKPVILAGNGCNEAVPELKKFAEAMQIPVCTTLHALGCFDERHELALNMIGMHGHATPNFLVQECDLLINIGSRFDDRITGTLTTFIPEARKASEEGRGGVVHVDVRRSEHGMQVDPTYFVHSTGKDFLTELNRQMGLDDPDNSKIDNNRVKSNRRNWLKHMKELQAKYPVPVMTYPHVTVTIEGPDGEPVQVSRARMSSQSVVSELNRQIVEAGISDEALFTTGVGIHQMVTAQHITWTQPRQMLSSGSLGTMGVALGYAIGAQLANGKKIVIAVDGDGSFNMTFTELKTVAQHKIPVKILILDNESDMMVEYWQRLFHDERYIAIKNENPDYGKLAGAFGIKSIYCDHADDLPGKLNEFLFEDKGEPVIMHVRVERTPCLPMVCPGKALDDMIHEDKAFEVDEGAAPS